MTRAPSAIRRHLGLWFPYLPADRLRIGRAGATPDAPIVFVEKVKGALRIASVDPSAKALGLLPGLTLADTRARIPDVEAVEHDPEGDRRWLDRLCEGCLRYTPNVLPDPPDGLTLDITGCAHLFGGEQALARDATARLERLGMMVRHAFAATAEAAQALARFGAADIAALPVAALRLDAEATLGLKRAGLKTVGALAARPMPVLAARFGDAAVTALHRLTAQSRSPPQPHRSVAIVCVERRFAEPVAHVDHILDSLAALVAEAVERLRERHQGGRRFEATLFRTDGLARGLAIETSMATRDPAMVMRLFAERIESLADPIDPGFGFDLLRLAVPVAEALDAAQLRLEGGAVNSAQVAALVDRLATRLGRHRVRRFAPCDTHIPEQTQLALPTGAPAPALDWPARTAGEPPLRPLHLFDPPQLVSVIAEVPDGPPRRFRWRHALHDVVLCEGPERIAAEWWRRRDGKGLTRDYYRIEDDAGRRYWIFRHGLFGDEKADPAWYLHGLFA